MKEIIPFVVPISAAVSCAIGSLIPFAAGCFVLSVYILFLVILPRIKNEKEEFEVKDILLKFLENKGVLICLIAACLSFSINSPGPFYVAISMYFILTICKID